MIYFAAARSGAGNTDVGEERLPVVLSLSHTHTLTGAVSS